MGKRLWGFKPWLGKVDLGRGQGVGTEVLVERGERASFDLSVLSHLCQMLEGPLDQGLVCRVGKLSSLPPKFHPDNTRKAYLTCVALTYLSRKGQVLAPRSCLSHKRNWWPCGV